MLRFLRQLSLSHTWPMLVAVAILTALGVLTIYADDAGAGQKQLIFAAIAMGCLVLFQMVDYRIIGTYAGVFYGISLALVIYTLGGPLHVPGVPYRNGAYNWIDLGPFSLQPSELLKVSTVMVMARYLRFRSNYRTVAGLIPPGVLTVVPMLVILKQPDLGTALIFIPTLFAMLFVAGAKWKHLLGVVAMGLVAGPMLWLCGLPGVPLFQHLPSLVKNYQRDRVYVMFTDDPEADLHTGFQQRYALMAMGSGGIFGKGPMHIPIGHSVPEGRNDMIFALIGEQFGVVGAILVIACFGAIMFVAIDIAGSTREPFGRLVAIGSIAMLSGQTFINLLVVMKMMPVTGVTLPFVSAGGSSLIASFMSVGLLLNIGQKRPIVMGKKVFEFGEG